MIKTDQDIQRNKQYTKGNSGYLTNGIKLAKQYKMMLKLYMGRRSENENFFLKVMWEWIFIIMLSRNHNHRRQNEINLVP